MQKIHPLNIFHILITLLILSYTSQQDEELCNYFSDCTCSICGLDRDYTTCDFINLFCEEGDNTFTSSFGTYKKNYLNYFKNEKDSEIFCGKQKSAEMKNNTETIITKLHEWK